MADPRPELTALLAAARACPSPLVLRAVTWFLVEYTAGRLTLAPYTTRPGHVDVETAEADARVTGHNAVVKVLGVLGLGARWRGLPSEAARGNDR